MRLANNIELRIINKRTHHESNRQNKRDIQIQA
jgi:hypothetical protein